jgi:hypothetical protein
MDERPTRKYLQARDSLPTKLQPIFDELISQFRYYGKLQGKRPAIPYTIIAALIVSGWRYMSGNEQEEIRFSVDSN